MSRDVRYSDKPKLNNKLVDCVLEHIEHEVEAGSGAYDQNTWAEIAVGRGREPVQCGTSGCFAGWACMLSTPIDEWREAFGLMCNVGPRAVANYDFSESAQEKLGLTDDEAGYLFGGHNGSNKRKQLEAIKGRVRVIREARAAGVSVYQHPEHDIYE
jgi:hypothetical protein